MEELQLVRPAPEHIEELQKFRQELLEAGDEDSFAGCSRLEHYEDVREWTVGRPYRLQCAAP